MRFRLFKRKNDIIDLSSMAGREFTEEKEPLQTENVQSGADFLSGLAGASLRQDFSGGLERKEGEKSITDSLREARKGNFNSKLNEMKMKIEDSEYRLSNALGKIRELEARVRELERR